jgi:8-oxo-dGTP pyrophosphatase MutT (NUDIX family)
MTNLPPSPFPIEYPPSAPVDLLANSTLISHWLSTINPSFQITSAKAHTLDVWPGPRIGFIELEVNYLLNDIAATERIILSGASVAVVPLIRSQNDRKLYTLLVEQPRIGAGKLTLEYPAGMADDSTDFRGVAVRELEEECGLRATEEELIDIGEQFTPFEKFAIFPERFDEVISVFALKRVMTEEEIRAIDRKQGGVDEEEQIVTKVVEFETVPNITTEGATLGITEVVQRLLAEGKL